MATFWIEDGRLYAIDLTPGSIEESLTKWEILFAASVAGDLTRDGGPSTCALCWGHQCSTCPIGTRTGGCMGTPYGDYHAAVERGDLPAAVSAAEEMMLFLEELLEESNGT